MLKIFLTAMVVLCCIKANAQNGQNVQEMMVMCKGPAVEKIYCLGQASGVLSVMQANAREPIAWRMCSPGFLTGGQAVQIFLNWAEKNPKHWQIPSAQGFALALKDAYPC